MTSTLTTKSLLLLVCLGAFATGPAYSQNKTPSDVPPIQQPTRAMVWNPQSAAKYLDDRQTWWMNWPESARDHQTFCVSCHTVVPYALAKPRLGSTLSRPEPTATDKRLLENVTVRVNGWKDMQPFYSDEKVGPHKTAQSRGTESILNALILSSFEQAAAQPSAVLQQAFHNMWAEQQRKGESKGAWLWLNFHTQPWEADDSPYFGATLAAVAVGTAPGQYFKRSEIQGQLRDLREYLQRGQEKRSLNNRLLLLWASTEIPDLLKPEQQQAIIDALASQQRPDGGWSMTSLVGNWQRGDGTPLETKSDGYATGLVCLAAKQAGVPETDVHLKKGLTWLATHQDKSQGLWPGYSLNKQRPASADAFLFMTDAATGYSILALTSPAKQQVSAGRSRPDTTEDSNINGHD
jgi:squalene-hopene/tetraprenyl-beta-curcumene cyclase